MNVFWLIQWYSVVPLNDHVHGISHKYITLLLVCDHQIACLLVSVALHLAGSTFPYYYFWAGSLISHQVHQQTTPAPHKHILPTYTRQGWGGTYPIPAFIQYLC